MMAPKQPGCSRHREAAQDSPGSLRSPDAGDGRLRVHAPSAQGHAARRNIPVIAVTAFGMSEDLHRTGQLRARIGGPSAWPAFRALGPPSRPRPPGTGLPLPKRSLASRPARPRRTERTTKVRFSTEAPYSSSRISVVPPLGSVTGGGLWRSCLTVDCRTRAQPVTCTRMAPLSGSSTSRSAARRPSRSRSVFSTLAALNSCPRTSSSTGAR